MAIRSKGSFYRINIDNTNEKRHEELLEQHRSLRIRDRNLRYTAIISAGGLMLSGATGGVSRYLYLNKIYSEQLAANLAALSVTFFGLGLIGIIIWSAIYLGIVGRVDTTNYQESATVGKLRKEVFELRELVKENLRGSSTVDISNEVNAVFLNRIQQDMEKMFGDAFLDTAKEELSAQYGPMVQKEKSLSSVAGLATIMMSDLKNQINIQQRNANFNVWSGMLFSTLGLMAMGFFVYYTSVSNGGVVAQNWTDFGISALPKVSFVLIFESIAFFFFRAYREDRSMVRYMRNEATNVESRLIGLTAAMVFGSEDTIKNSVSSLMKTERNFIVKKGERVIIDPETMDNAFMIEKIVDRIIPKIRSRQDQTGN